MEAKSWDTWHRDSGTLHVRRPQNTEQWTVSCPFWEIHIDEIVPT